MKIALVHDYLSQDGGAEYVLETMHRIWPDAPIFVLFHDEKSIQRFSGLDVRESFFRYLPFGRSKYQWYVSLMPLATERHNVHDFDVVISSSSAFAKGVLTRPDTLHISYCHTPTRYLWTDTHEYLADLKYPSFIKAFLPGLIHRLRIWDKMSVDRVDYFLANSITVKNRIQKYYRRDADIIYPPVDIASFFISDRIGDYFVSGGRMVPYKRFDILVDAFNRLGWPLKIFGDGPERKRLMRRAKPNIQFLGRISNAERADLLSHAQAFIHPQVEDFGMTPIEAMASGRPVIAFGKGGVTETVIPGKTGIFFHAQRWESLVNALLDFDPHAWDAVQIREWAGRYDAPHFRDRIHKYVEDRYEAFGQGLRQCQLDVR